jgi:hypothetical protein
MANTVLLRSVSSGADEAERQATIDVSNKTELFVEVLFSHGSATHVEIIPEFSTDSGAYYSRLTSRDISGGVGTLSLYSDKLAVTGNVNFSTRYDVTVADYVRLTVDFTSPSGDNFTLKAATV